MGDLFEFIKSALIIAFILIWSFGGFVGAIYWAVKNDLLNVVLSIFIPGYGAISIVGDLFF